MGFYIFIVSMYVADHPHFFTVSKGLQRHSVDCWMTYNRFSKDGCYCKMSFELQESVAFVTYWVTENPSSEERTIHQFWRRGQ